MPSKSAAQHRLMEGVAHSEKFAKKVGIPMKVGKEFTEADKRVNERKKYHNSKRLHVKRKK